MNERDNREALYEAIAAPAGTTFMLTDIELLADVVASDHLNAEEAEATQAAMRTDGTVLVSAEHQKPFSETNVLGRARRHRASP